MACFEPNKQHLVQQTDWHTPYYNSIYKNTIYILYYASGEVLINSYVEQILFHGNA